MLRHALRQARCRSRLPAAARAAARRPAGGAAPSRVSSSAAAGRAPEAGLPPFVLERFFAKYEHEVPNGLMCCSDPEPYTAADVLAMAGEEERAVWDGLTLNYTEPRGLPRLREEVAAMYGGGVKADEVLVVAPEEGIYVAMRTLLREGDRVVCVGPAYQSLHSLARSAGCRVDEWELRPGDGGWRGDVAELERAIAAEPTRLVVLNTPHNPTGHHLTRAELDRVVTAARAAGSWLFCDEMYRGLERDAADRLPPAFTLYDRAVSLSGVSKSLGGPGLRIGWLCSRDAALMGELQLYKDYTTICTSAPSEALALILVRERERVWRRMAGILWPNLDAVRAFVARVPWAFSLAEPRAGSVCFLQLLLPGVSDEAFVDRVVRETGMLLLPGSLMGCPGFLRVGIGRRNLPGLLDRLAEFVEREYPERAASK